MSRLLTRLTRLEHARNTGEPPLRYFTLWTDEPDPPDLRVTDVVMRLPRKAETVEAWMAQCRELGFGPGAREEA